MLGPMLFKNYYYNLPAHIYLFTSIYADALLLNHLWKRIPAVNTTSRLNLHGKIFYFLLTVYKLFWEWKFLRLTFLIAVFFSSFHDMQTPDMFNFLNENFVIRFYKVKFFK